MKDITKFPPNMLKRKNLNHWVRTLMNTALTYINPFTPKISLEILLTVYQKFLRCEFEALGNKIISQILNKNTSPYFHNALLVI